jgi:predicted nucleic acid-binding Zn ribbon protein
MIELVNDGESRQCLECGERIYGRSDKKFCSDLCRNAFNNRNNSNANDLIRNTNNLLRKNRRILYVLSPNGKAKVSRDELSRKGFNFNYFTNIYMTRQGKTYYFCYDMGYVELEPNWFAVVLKQEYVS